jgi:ribonuclease III
MALTQWWRRLFRRRNRPIDATATGLLSEFQEHVGFHFRDPSLLQQALTHRSWLGASGSDLSTSNERMEFLGDSVLELVVNEHLYARYPDLQEGELTKMKSLLVSRNILSYQAREMGLGRFLFLSEAEQDSGGRDRPSILADAFEAVVGAIYLDGGMESARGFLRQRLLTSAQGILGDRKFTNYKSLLQEFVQSEYKTYPRYRISAQSGPDHKKLFTVDVSVKGRKLGEGKGPNKKRAEQSAARDALEVLRIL